MCKHWARLPGQDARMSRTAGEAARSGARARADERWRCTGRVEQSKRLAERIVADVDAHAQMGRDKRSGENSHSRKPQAA